MRGAPPAVPNATRPTEELRDKAFGSRGRRYSRALTRSSNNTLFAAMHLVRNWHARAMIVLAQEAGGEAAVSRDAEMCYPSVGSTGGNGSETGGVHRAARRCGGGLAARGTCTATGDAGDRIPQREVTR